MLDSTIELLSFECRVGARRNSDVEWGAGWGGRPWSALPVLEREMGDTTTALPRRGAGTFSGIMVSNRDIKSKCLSPNRR
jgi:hypothetical protein